MGKVAVALANPYPYPLKWRRALEFEILATETPAGNWPSRIWDAPGQPAYLPQSTAEPESSPLACAMLPRTPPSRSR